MVGSLNNTETMWGKDALTALQRKSIAYALPHLATWQADALQQFLAQGFPTRKDEAWKYTNVSALAKQSFSLQEDFEASVDISEYEHENTHRIVFVNGSFVAELSALDDLPEGVVVVDLEAALNDKQMENYLPIEQRYQNSFSKLNAALLTNGLFLQVAPGVVVNRLIHVLYINTDSDQSHVDQPHMNHPRHLILADESSAVTVLEEYVGEESTYFNNVVTQIYAGSNAKVEHYKLQNEGQTAFHIANTIIDQQRDSAVSTYHFALGAKLTRDNLHYLLKEQGVNCRMIGFYHGAGAQHVDQHTQVDHLVPNGSSEQVYKGIVSEKARAVFNGKVIVHPDAQQTTAHQSNKNLLLSKNAEVDTKPELEIYADDVKCSHSATIGQLDDKALFYLQSRGISKQKARHMLTCAFATELLGMIPNVALASYIQQRVERCLSQHKGGE